MKPEELFRQEVEANIRGLATDQDLQALTRIWIREVAKYRYTYNFRWLGRPIIQTPQDMIAVQEIVWQTRPDIIIETGVAHGGSVVYSASLLELLGGDRFVVGVDIDIRAHNRAALESHPLFHRIRLVEGSSIDPQVISKVRDMVDGRKSVLVLLDSNHTHDHVLQELRAYSSFVDDANYIVVFDTLLEDLPEDLIKDRPWGKGNNPKTAVRQFLAENNRFVVDTDIEHKLLISVAPGGYLRCVKGTK